MKSSLLIPLLAFSLTACAQSAPDTGTKAPVAAAPSDAQAAARAREAIRKLAPNADIQYVGPAIIPGFQEVVAMRSTFFVSNDGKYLVNGKIFDVERTIDVTDHAYAGIRKEALAKVPKSERIVFAASNPKHVVTVFTDVECGYCRRMHQDIAQYNAAGITIEYLAYPRAGMGSADAKLMEAVWCSADRKAALTEAKAGRPVPPKTCTNPVGRHHDIGEVVGLQGTPMVITSEGVALPGYMPPADMLRLLDVLSGETPPKAPAAAAAAGEPAKAAP